LGTVALANERLRALLLERRVTVAKLAEAVQVDAKTVERWIMAGRVPYRKHRYNVAAFFGVDESFIWPDALDHDQVMAASESEIVAVYPYRRAVPRDAWGHLFGQAEQEIGILAYSCYFLAEDAGLRQLIAEKADSGARVRILLGDPESPFVLQRGQSEGIGDTMPAKVRSAIAMFRPLGSVENVEIRLHGTILYNSIFRADDQLFVNTHIYGVMANNAPFFHLRKIPGGAIAATYLESFERVWSEAEPLSEGNDG
jgi:transcriptional regulator with XRE-family HTH domain